MRKIATQLGFKEQRRKIEKGFEWIKYSLFLEEEQREDEEARTETRKKEEKE